MSDDDDEDALTQQLNLRVSKRDIDRLNKVRGPVPRSLLAREAMRRGLEDFEKDPALVLKIPPSTPGPKPAPKRRPKAD